MYRTLYRGLLAGGVGAALWLAQAAQAIQLDFASLSLTSISFDGAGHFMFLPVGGNQFQIKNSSGVGDAINDFGRMDGTWTFGPVSSPSSGEFEAPVMGKGTLVIHDGLGNDLTGSLTWDLIETKGTGGTLNLNGVINLSGLSYSGPQIDLQQLATEQGGNAVEDLHFSTIEPNGTQVTLAQLASGSTLTSSFNGKIVALPSTHVPDGGSSMLLLGSAFLFIEGIRRKLRK